MGFALPRTISLPNLKFLASPVPNLRSGVYNLKIPPLDPDHATFVDILSPVSGDLPSSISTVYRFFTHTSSPVA